MKSEEQIYDAITAERERQKTLGYTDLHDDLQGLDDWGFVMNGYLPRGDDDLDANEAQVTKLAAMCIALLESIQRRRVLLAGAQA